MTTITAARILYSLHLAGFLAGLTSFALFWGAMAKDGRCTKATRRLASPAVLLLVCMGAPLAFNLTPGPTGPVALWAFTLMFWRLRRQGLISKAHPSAHPVRKSLTWTGRQMRRLWHAASVWSRPEHREPRRKASHVHAS